MSYILDALKKVEKDRQKNPVPDLTTDHKKQKPVSKKRSPWPYLFLAAILLNAVLLTVWLIPRQSPKDGTTPELKIEDKDTLASTQTDKKIVASIPVKDESEVSADPVIAEDPETTLTKEPAVLEDDDIEMSASINTNADGRIPDINELPSSVRDDLPEIKISGHVYFETPEDRLVIVNGRTAREGQTVASGLQIEEITKSGVIFIYDNRRFSMKGF